MIVFVVCEYIMCWWFYVMINSFDYMNVFIFDIILWVVFGVIDLKVKVELISWF